MKRKVKKRLLVWLLSISMVAGPFGIRVLAAPDEETQTLTYAGGLCEHHAEHTAQCGYVQGQPCGHVHTEECYETVTECVHAHTQECYPEEIPDDSAQDEASGDEFPKGETGNASAPERCGHVCSEESGCVVKILKCVHEHDDGCGYAQAYDCTYQCDICSGILPQEPAADGAETDQPEADGVISGDSQFGETDGENGEADKESGGETEGLCPHHEQHTQECGGLEEGEEALCAYECVICEVQELINALPDAQEISEDNAQEIAQRIAEIEEKMDGLTLEEAGLVDLTRFEAVYAALLAFAQKPALTADGTTVREERLDVSAMTGFQQNVSEGWAWDAGSNTLTLNNCHIRTENSGGMIRFPGDCQINIVLEGENILESAQMNYAAMIDNNQGRSNNDWVIRGSGSLEFRAQGDAPSSGYYPYGFPGRNLTIESGTVKSNVSLCMLLGSFTMESGSVTVDCSAGSQSDGIYANSGPVDIKGGSVNINAGRVGIYVPGLSTSGDRSINISGGDITVSGGASAIRIDDRGAGDAQTINITGGSVKAQSTSSGSMIAKEINLSGSGSVESNSANQPGIWAKEDLNVGENVQVTAKSENSYGLYVQGNLNVQDTALVTATGTVDAAAPSLSLGDNAQLNGMVRTDTSDGRIWTVYGNAELHSDLTLGPDAYTNASGGKLPVKLVVMPGATLTVPEGKKLDATQGITVETLKDYLSGDVDAVIAKGDPDSSVLLPQPEYQIEVSAQPPAGGTVTGGGVYPGKTSVTVTAQAAQGYRFVKWTEGGAEIAGEGEAYTFQVTGDRNLTAIFEKVNVPTPTPTPEKDPDPTPTPGEEPVLTPTPSAEPDPTATPSAEPDPTTTPSAEPDPTATPGENPTPTPGMNPTPTPGRDPEPEPTPDHDRREERTQDSGNTETGSASSVTVQAPAVRTAEAVAVDKKGNAVINRTAVDKAIRRAKPEAQILAVSLSVAAGVAQKSCEVTIEAQALDELIKCNAGSFRITVNNLIVMGFDRELLESLDTRSGEGYLVLRIHRLEKAELPATAQAVIWDHPAYEITLVLVQGQEETVLTDLEGATVLLGLGYTGPETEPVENLRGVFVDQRGKAGWIKESAYDEKRKAVMLEDGRLGIYGVACRPQD